jgi:hypothetical protein
MRLLAVGVGIIVCIILVRNLNPFDPRMFEFHDVTQRARIVEFLLSVLTGYWPPRVATLMYYYLSYPAFTFYAPAAYWISLVFSLLYLEVFPRITPLIDVFTLKSSFAAAIFTSWIGMYALVSHLTGNRIAAIISATVYSSSPWVAVEVFVRGNLAEMWFLALLPLTLALLHISSTTKHRAMCILTAITTSLLFTSHNALSLVTIPLVCIYCGLFLRHKNVFILLALALGLTAYFWIPFVTQLPLTNAVAVATSTKYEDHYLCLKQLWTNPAGWGFGGSGPGCETDGMSFMVGKVLIILFAGSSVYLLLNLVKRKVVQRPYIAYFLITIGALFLTLPISKPFWKIISPLQGFQFPWRFLVFVLFGMSTCVGLGIGKLSQESSKRKKIHAVITSTIVLAVLGGLFLNARYFDNNSISYEHGVNVNRLTKLIVDEAAFAMPEYFSRNIDRNNLSWIKEKGNPKTKDDTSVTLSYDTDILRNYVLRVKTTERQVTLPIHYFPWWRIVDEKTSQLIIPETFDMYGRPVIPATASNTIRIRYEQTPIEKTSNAITLFSFIALCAYVFRFFHHEST